MHHVALLRGINLGAKRRVPMAPLRELLTEAGYEDVRTYLQSGNIVLGAAGKPEALQAALSTLISERFGFEVPVVVRSRSDLARVVAQDPFADLVTEPKRYQVSFLAGPLDSATAQVLQDAVADGERVAICEQEIYAWHPDGVARSKLWNALAGPRLSVVSTARNWSTVLALLEMATTADG